MLNHTLTKARIACLVAVLGTISGCETIGFYSQAIGGQWGVLAKREHIEKLLAAADTKPELKTRLQLVQDIRLFAEQQLGLPVDKSYASYVDLHRPADDNFVVWNVFAAPSLSLAAHNWCYPLIGCAAYRGYFSRERAERYAQRLQQQGLDTYIAGVTAYSTLGWFADPVLSTFAQLDDARLASLLFHELAHKLVYIRDNTEFNESFASAVASEALRRWLQSRGQSDLLANVERHRAAREALIARVDQLREALDLLYQADELSEDEKTALKEREFARFRASVMRLKPSAATQRWLQGVHNNASLVPIRSYQRWQNAFAQLLREQRFEMPDFYEAVKTLGKLNPVEQERELQKLTDSHAASVQKLTND